MKTRDNLNSEEGYLEIIEINQESIEEYTAMLNNIQNGTDTSLERPQNESIYLLKDNIFLDKFDNLIAKYSCGFTLKEIEDEFNSVLKSMVEVWSIRSGYHEMLQMLSLAILMDVNNDSFIQLSNLCKNQKVEDFLLDFLIKTRNNSWEITQNLLYQKEYQTLKKVIQLPDKVAATNLLLQFLEKEWYQIHDFTGTHLNEENIHSGYWSFESGAISKILRLENAILSKSNYYPKDLIS